MALWVVGARTCVGSMAARHSHPVTTLAALPDGRLVGGSYVGAIQLWDTRPAAAAAVAATSRAAGTVPTTVLAHIPGRDKVTALALLPDGRVACACGEEVFLFKVTPPVVYK